MENQETDDAAAMARVPPPLPGSTGHTVNGQYGHTEYKTMLEAMEDNRIFTIKRTDGGFEIREHCDGWYWAYLTPGQLRALAQELIDLSNVKRSEPDQK